MQKLTSFYIYPEDGKRLTENGKDAGVLVIAPESKDISTFGNVKEIKEVVEYIADEGKTFRNKNDGSLEHIINKESLDDFEEVELFEDDELDLLELELEPAERVEPPLVLLLPPEPLSKAVPSA